MGASSRVVLALATLLVVGVGLLARREHPAIAATVVQDSVVVASARSPLPAAPIASAPSESAPAAKPTVASSPTRRTSARTMPSAPAAPHLDTMTPDSANVDESSVIEVLLTGSGFTPTDNVVTFGPLSGGSAKSADGRHVTFYAQTQLRSRGEVPPGRLAAGAYPVTVTNANGTSNARTFRLRSGAP